MDATNGNSATSGAGAVRAPRTAEQIAAGAIMAMLARGLFALTASVDDAEKQYGPKLYENMMADPTVGSSVDVLRQAAIREVQFAPPKAFRPKPGADPTPEQAKAAEVCDRVKRAWNNPERPLAETLYEWTYGLVQDSLAEVVLEKVFEGPDAGYFTFRAFKFKPRSAWNYVVDDYGNVPFVAGQVPPGVQPTGDAAAVPGTGGNAVLLEPDRFAVFAWGRRNSDPRGRPILRRAYNAWNLKVRTWPEKLRGDVQFGTPSVAAILPEVVDDPEPASVKDLKLPDGGTVATAEDLVLYCLLKLQNGTGAVFPAGTQLQVIESERDGTTLNQSIELYNREIGTAILHTPRTTQEAAGGTRSEGEQKQDVFELLVCLIRSMLAGLIRNVSRNLVRLNDGPEAAATMVPDVSLGEVGHQDLAKLITALAAWVKAGAPTASQMAAFDLMLGLDPREPGEASLADAAAERAEAIAGKRGQNGQVGGGENEPADDPKPPAEDDREGD